MRRLGLVSLLLIGCTDDAPPAKPETVRLADGDAWVRVVDPGVDSFADMRPADAVCDDAGYFVDPLTGVFEIQTEVCDYLTLEQPTLVDLEPGDVVTLQAYHDVLTAPDPAEGYLGLALAGEIELEYTVAIPADVAIIERQFTVDRELPAGTKLQVHVHNHGPNTWELVAVAATLEGG